MPVTAEQLVGREEELSLIERALAETEGGSPSLLEISGEPGIGKTTLLAEIGRRGEEGNRLVLTGRASELERDLPYWIFVDALDEYLRTLDPDRIRGIDQDAGGELSRIFPALAGGPAPAATVLHERYRVHLAVRTLLEELAGTKGLVLLLDDLHWGDPASVDLVGALLRRPPQAGVLIALALRPRQAPPRLATALHASDRAGDLIRIEPRRLQEAEAQGLLGSDVAPALAKALYVESGGNPFYLEQLARAGAPARVARASNAAPVTDGAEVPPAVTAALADELAGLPAETRAVLEASAVIGDPFELELAATAADVTEVEVLAALDELLAKGLVHRTEVPRRFRFRHPILRRAVYDATGSAWRRAAHERAARTLAAHGASPTAQAHHVDQFAVIGDLDAVRLFRDAGESNAQRAPASAARWYRAALRLLPADSANADVRVELLERLAAVLAGTGQVDESRAALLELLELVPPEASALRVRATAACAGVEHLVGRHEQAHARLLTTLEQLPDRDSPDAAALLIDLAMDAYFRRDYERMRDWGRQAADLARRLGDAPLTAAADAVTCLADAYGGRIEDAEAQREKAARTVDALGDDELAFRVDAAANLGAAEIYLDRYESAVAHLSRGLAVSRTTGQGQLFPLLTQELGVALSLLGRLAEAADHLDGAVEAARLAGNRQSLAWTLMNRAWTALMTGDLDAALTAAEESAELVDDLDESPLSSWSASILGAVLIEAGDPARAIDVILPASGGPELGLIPGDFRVMIQERVTQAWLALGRQDEAEAAAQRAESRAAELGLGMSRAVSARARASVLLAAGDAAAASTVALESATAADEVGARIEGARSRTLAGRALLAVGDRDGAASELGKAALELDACGAVRYRDEAERELRRLGQRQHRRRGTTRASGEGLAALSERELEVARLVRDRKTNPQIAAELFLSKKTVETHLRNVFRKLDVTSRVELARAIERAER